MDLLRGMAFSYERRINYSDMMEVSEIFSRKEFLALLYSTRLSGELSMNLLGVQNINNYYGVCRNLSPQKSGTFQRENASMDLETKQVPIFHLKLGYLYSSTDVNGQELYMNYDESSTEEEPVMLAEGIDMQGNPFKRKIYLNQIDINNASIVEMTALDVHLREQGDTNSSSRVNIPLDTLSSRIDLNQKMDFQNYYSSESRKFQGAGFKEEADFYKGLVERYLFFHKYKMLKCN